MDKLNTLGCLYKSNKAVFMTASVAYRWAGAVMQVRSLFCLNLHCVTDRLANRVTYRVVCTQLKISN